jgi:hypothetical protein
VPLPVEEQVYARWLDWGTRIGLAALVAGFFAYALGIVEPLVPLERLPELWSLPVERYVALTGAPTGWAWLGQIGKGEPLCLLGIALLSLVTLVCYLRLVVTLVRAGARLQAGMAIAQVVVLLAATSSLLAGGH